MYNLLRTTYAGKDVLRDHLHGNFIIDVLLQSNVLRFCQLSTSYEHGLGIDNYRTCLVEGCRYSRRTFLTFSPVYNTGSSLEIPLALQ